MSSAVDGTDDDMLWNGSGGDVHVRGECEEDEGTDCADGDSDTDWYRQIKSDTLCLLSVRSSTIFLLSKHFLLSGSSWINPCLANVENMVSS